MGREERRKEIKNILLVLGMGSKKRK